MTWRAVALALALALVAACSEPRTEPFGGALTLTTAPTALSGYDVTFDGEAFAIAWASAGEGDEHVWFARVSLTGELIDAPTRIATVTTAYTRVRIVRTDVGYAVVYWTWDTVVAGVVLDPAGAVLTSLQTTERINTWDRGADVATNGSTVALVYVASGSLLRGRLFSPTLAPLAPTFDLEVGEEPDLVFADDAFRAIWSRSSSANRTTTITTSAVAPAQMIRDEGMLQRTPRAVRLTTGWLHAWRSVPSDIGEQLAFFYAADAGATAWAASRQLLPANRDAQFELAMASLDDGRALIAWRSDELAAAPDLQVAAFDPAIDGELPTESAVVPREWRPRHPVLATGGGAAALVVGVVADGSEHLLFLPLAVDTSARE